MSESIYKASVPVKLGGKGDYKNTQFSIEVGASTLDDLYKLVEQVIEDNARRVSTKMQSGNVSFYAPAQPNEAPPTRARSDAEIERMLEKADYGEGADSSAGAD